jgi:cellulose synthase/poly-beta-1,6-N-acetylglucosamine synthase-like glycosyltransferase
LELLEEQALLGLLQFFQTNAYLLDGNLFIGSISSPEQFFVPANTHALFLIFFPAIALATRASLKIKLKILFFGFLCFISFLILELFLILILNAFDLGTSISYLHSSIIFSGLVGAAVIEISLMKILTLPKSQAIRPIIKRTYFEEYVYLFLLIIFGSLLIYALFNTLEIREDTVVSAYLALGLSTILTFKYYLSYFIWEIKKPLWVSLREKKFKQRKWKVSFLCPAFNEEKTMKRLIESIDIAASKYDGETEIIIINDGSIDNTEKISKEALERLRFSKSKLYSIPNSGKGFALQYGLQKISGDIIFRVDSDSRVDEHIITRVIRYYDDPSVGSVSGMLFPLEAKNLWQKLWFFLSAINIFYRKGQHLLDSILVQPGVFSTFRVDAIKKTGGWSIDQFGEDGEITLRLGRYGYRHIFEEHAIVYSDVPENFQELREQRVRWSIAFFHSRAKNIHILKEYNGPRTIMLFFNLLLHGGGYAQMLFWPFLAVALFFDEKYSALNFVTLLGIPLKLFIIDLVVYGVQYFIYFYNLYRFKQLHLVKYLPFMRIYALILSIFLKPEALEILLRFSSKWNRHTKESNDDLRKIMKTSLKEF